MHHNKPLWKHHLFSTGPIATWKSSCRRPSAHIDTYPSHYVWQFPDRCKLQLATWGEKKKAVTRNKRCSVLYLTSSFVWYGVIVAFIVSFACCDFVQIIWHTCEERSRVTISLPGEYLFTLCISITVTVLSQEFVVLSSSHLCYLLYAFLLYLCIGCPGPGPVHP